MPINWLDILIIIPVCWFGFKGLKSGLVRELASIIALIAGIVIASKFSSYLASRLGSSETMEIIAFIILFIGVLILVFFVGRLLEKAVNLVFSSFVNHLFGLLFGISKVLIIFSVIFFMINSVDSKEILLRRATKAQSFLYQYIEPIFPKCKAWLNEKLEN